MPPPAKFPNIPPVWWSLCVLAIFAVRALLPALRWNSGVLDLIGAILFSAAVLITFWSAYWFWRKSTPIHPGHTPEALISDGPFRFSRNPIYLSMVISAAGIALYAGFLPGLIIVAGLWLWLDHAFAKPEEQGLRDAFGVQAEVYITATRRWI